MAQIEHLDLAKYTQFKKKTSRKRTLSDSNYDDCKANTWINIKTDSTQSCSICAESIECNHMIIPTCCKQITCNECFKKINQILCPYCRTEITIIPIHILKNIEKMKSELQQAELAAEPDVRLELIRAERLANGECCCEVCIERYLDILRADEDARSIMRTALGPDIDQELDLEIANLENEAAEADEADEADEDEDDNIMPLIEEPIIILSNWISIDTPIRCASCFDTTEVGVNAWVSSCCANGVDGNLPNGYCVECFPQIDPNTSRCVTCNNLTRAHDIHTCNCITCQSNLQLDMYQAILTEDDTLEMEHPNKLSEDERIYYQILMVDAQTIIEQNAFNHFYRIIQNIMPNNENPIIENPIIENPIIENP
jgi:hypothetical protein